MLTLSLSCPIHDSFRVRQVAGMFDVPLADKAHEQFSAEVPGLDEPWQIGLITGPSGSGKTSIARAAFGPWFYDRGNWPADRAVIDGFGELPIREITGLLTAVGFSSPPSWIKPYRVLSNGEQFRCDLARALAPELPSDVAPAGNPKSKIQNQTCSLVVFDEFSSVVDRTVARIASAAVAQGIRGGRIARRLVAVTCHYDVAEWLAPDWTLDLATATLSRGRLRRPDIRLEIVPASRRAWPLFARHHYLNPGLSSFADCYLALWDNAPVAICAVLPLAGRGRQGWRRISRLVVLPDYQGIGIGGRFCTAVADLLARQGHRVSITTGHPAMFAFLQHSNDWRVSQVYKAGGHKHARLQNAGSRGAARGSTGRPVISAVFRPSTEPSPQAKGNTKYESRRAGTKQMEDRESER